MPSLDICSLVWWDTRNGKGNVMTDYTTNRFIFIKWLDTDCDICDYHLAKMLDKYDLKDNIEYCFNCKERN